MSLINKMLQDLDARGTTRAEGVPPEIKPVGGDERRLALGRTGAIAGAVVGVLVLALGAAAWIIFPLKGKSYDEQPAVPIPAAPVTPVTVTEVAPQPPAPAPAPAAAPAQAPAAPPAAPEPEQVAAAPRKPAPAVKEQPVPAAPRPAAPERQTAASTTAPTTSYAVASARARAEQERLEKRWAAEEVRIAKLPADQRGVAGRRLREEQARAAERTRQEMRWLASLQRKEMEAGGLPAVAAPVPAAAGPGRSETDTHGAENAYRRALAAMQEGRVSEAMAGLQAALRISPRHEAARQTLVSLLIENNRGDEAMTQLQQALSLDPRQPALAMLLARLQIERGKSGIEALLRTLPYAGGNGEYHAFLAGALQRQNRSREAADQYQTALRTAPNNAVWWMGLGMALQGDKRNAEALDAFRQAKAMGTLSPELQAFVERRLQQLR